MIQVIKRVSDILELIAEEPENPVFLKDIAQKSALNHSTCANILKTLVNLDFLEQPNPKKGYILGPRMYYLTRNGPYRKDIIRIAELLIAELTKDIEETALIAIFHNGKRSILCQVDGNQVLQIKNEFINRSDVYETATGRLLLSYLSQRELEFFIRQNGLPSKEIWAEVDTEEKLRDVLLKIKKEKSVITYKPKVVGIAFPIKERDKIIAALGVFLPTFRFKGNHKKEILKKMKGTSEKISFQISQNGGAK